MADLRAGGREDAPMGVRELPNNRFFCQACQGHLSTWAMKQAPGKVSKMACGE